MLVEFICTHKGLMSVLMTVLSIGSIALVVWLVCTICVNICVKLTEFFKDREFKNRWKKLSKKEIEAREKTKERWERFWNVIGHIFVSGVICVLLFLVWLMLSTMYDWWVLHICNL